MLRKKVIIRNCFWKAARNYSKDVDVYKRQMQNKYYPHLASPLTIKGLTFKNRILGAPMSNPEMDPDSHMPVSYTHLDCCGK